MFTNQDVKYRSIFVINTLEAKSLRLHQGELLLTDANSGKTLTKLPFQKILALFIIGHATITTPLIDKCNRYGISIVVMKPNFRPVFYYGATAEANFLIREKQYQFPKRDICIARHIVANKIYNQIVLLSAIRKKDDTTLHAIEQCRYLVNSIEHCREYDILMGIEGRAAKSMYMAYFGHVGWESRSPRTKLDPINTTLDIGYTILFNYIEVFVRLFGFDPYIGVYHQLWFKRKSLICDLMEPFRCIIDQSVRKAFNNKHFSKEDFILKQHQYLLKYENNSKYTAYFYKILIEYKKEVFCYIRDYYRYFMGRQSVAECPMFLLK